MNWPHLYRPCCSLRSAQQPNPVTSEENHEPANLDRNHSRRRYCAGGLLQTEQIAADQMILNVLTAALCLISTGLLHGGHNGIHIDRGLDPHGKRQQQAQGKRGKAAEECSRLAEER